jgi:uncharacterized protein
MNCPKCNVSLVMSERQGIEIDYCPQCRGVWLDRGELDKIIERSSAQPENSNFSSHGRYQEGPSHDKHESYRHKRKGFLGELFD